MVFQLAAHSLVVALALPFVQQPTPAPEPNRAPDACPGVPAVPDAPNVEGGWSVVTVIRGGITSANARNVMLRSDALSQCNGVPCAGSLDASAKATIASLITEPWPAPNMSLNATCSDCMQTFIVASRRNGRGEQETRVACWDDTTLGRAPAAARRLFASIASVWTDTGR